MAARRLAASQRRTAITVPALGSDEEMKKQAVEQIRARVEYQKELMAAQDHHHEDVGEMWRWLNLTFWVGLPVCLLSATYSLLFDEHPHRVEGELPEYMKIRNKEFPWECGDCDIFDLQCWKKCRAEKM
jgi:cytochrome c oxidase subunit 6a